MKSYKRKTVNDYRYEHEVISYARLCLELFNEYIEEHELVQLDQKLRERAEFVSEALADFYRDCVHHKFKKMSPLAKILRENRHG